jgi:hypothetical protein
MCLDAHGIVYLRITGNFLQSLMPRPCLCCLHQTGAQSVTTTILIHVPSFDANRATGSFTPVSTFADLMPAVSPHGFRLSLSRHDTVVVRVAHRQKARLPFHTLLWTPPSVTSVLPSAT